MSSPNDHVNDDDDDRPSSSSSVRLWQLENELEPSLSVASAARSSIASQSHAERWAAAA
eukprot:CAMPEP_0181048520 /NCGR_PEP_ID=MMETSP1070-20121207/15479_1 /TAXON_ID=265543 /ORGANISM="Minutocellus polymorphus, Strain NH13" /LENGTH=58 /DNA_ID=CAMNT_0023127309 /DNA_START=487 /DNA_END=659 /DNA_ORIENTATION=-